MGYLVGTPWRTMLGDGLAEDLKYCLWTTRREPWNNINYVESSKSLASNQ
jgi:hypothetical protein